MKNDIFKKQNEPNILDALFSQRYYYNTANKLDTINLILILITCILSSFTIEDNMYKIVVNIVLVLISWCLSNLTVQNIKKGALIKKYIDYELFSFKIDKESIKKAKGYIFDVIKKHLKNYNQQINNDGNGNPPGLKDWYYDENKVGCINQIKSCQSQNTTWDNRISKIYLIMLLVLFSILSVIYIIISSINKCDILNFFAGAIPFANVIVFFMKRCLNYFKIKKIIDEANSKLQLASTKNALLDIQKCIDIRRENEFVPPNFVHKIISKDMHEKIKFVSK